MLLIVVQMNDTDMQQYYDDFFEEVFVETHDKVALQFFTWLLLKEGWYFVGHFRCIYLPVSIFLER